MNIQEAISTNIPVQKIVLNQLGYQRCHQSVGKVSEQMFVMFGNKLQNEKSNLKKKKIIRCKPFSMNHKNHT